MIWYEAHTNGVHSAYRNLGGICAFCHTETQNLGIVPRNLGFEITDPDHEEIFARVCPACGWWELSGVIDGTFGADDPFTPGAYSQREMIATAALMNLDLADDTTPIDDVRKYLMARGESGRALHPRLFEETVASVFRNFGFDARVTAYSGDGGIDVILDGGDGKIIGVQVKRYGNKVKAEHIRSFVGALVIEGYCMGIFVTTSDFQKGCYVAADKAAQQNLPVSLVTGQRFREALSIANVYSFQPPALDVPPFITAPLYTECYRGEWCSGPYQYVWESSQDDTSQPPDGHDLRIPGSGSNAHGSQK